MQPCFSKARRPQTATHTISYFISGMTAVVATNNSGPKADANGPSGGPTKAVSAEEAQAILSSIASKIHGTSSAATATGTNAEGSKSGGSSNDGATAEVTGADLATLRAVAFDSEEGKKVRDWGLLARISVLPLALTALTTDAFYHHLHKIFTCRPFPSWIGNISAPAPRPRPLASFGSSASSKTRWIPNTIRPR